MENENGGVLGPREQSKEQVGSKGRKPTSRSARVSWIGSIDIEPGGAGAHSSQSLVPPRSP